MSVLKRYTKSVDGTIPVQALLYEDEDLLASQDGVGIYNGTQKAPNHQAGTVYATTHRLFYIDASNPDGRSFWLNLSHVTRTEYYAGLLRSSSKVTLYLNPSLARPAQSENEAGSSRPQASDDENWECSVCSYRNPPGLSPAAAKVCGLCGVPRASAVLKARSVPQQLASQHLSSSLPSPSINLPALTSGSSPIPNAAQEIPCPACTFLNHPSLRECEICGTALPRIQPRSAVKSAPASRPGSDDEDDEEDKADEDSPRMIRVSFRKGGDKPFYAVLRRSLLGKAWETTSATSTASRPTAAPSTATRSGINGILQNVEATASTAETNMMGALQDLEALMVKAREMVRLAEDLNERLSAASTSASANARGADVAGGGGVVEPEEATFIRSSLAQLGLQMPNAPVTLDMTRDERKWTEELARELAGVLQGAGGKAAAGALMRQRGVVGLDEVWGGWNRARGVALIPPATFLLVLPHLPAYTSPPVHKRTFASGLAVLHTPPYSKAAFAARLVGLIRLVGPRTTVEIAQEEQIPIGLAQDMVLEVEGEGEICRDEGGEGIGVFSARAQTRWWVNVFKDYAWDGQAD